MQTIDERRHRRPMSVISVMWKSGALALALATPGTDRAAQEATRLLGLEALAREALDANRELLAAREGLAVAEEQVSEAWSNVYPSIDASASYSRNITPNVNFLPAIFFDPTAGPDDYIPIQFGADNQWNASVNFEQPLLRAGVFVGVGAAGRFRSFQNEVVRGEAQTVVTELRTTYYRLLLAQEQLRLTDRSVERVRQSLHETQALNRAGLASDYDVLRLEVELANLEPNLRRAENAMLQARRQRAIQANLDDAESLRVSGTLAEMNLEDVSDNSAANREILAFMGFRGDGLETVDEALTLAAGGRSDLRQLELNEDLRRAEMRVEQMEYVPEITLFGNYLINAQDNGSPNFFARGDGQRAYSRIVGLRVSVPVFQGFRRDARIDQRRASLRQAQAQTRQLVDVAASQVRTLVEAADEALDRARGQRLAVTQAGRGYEIATAQYREGLGSQLELTDAEVALRQSEFNYAQAVYDFLVARAELDQATGRVPLVDLDVTDAGL
ncbi:MAG TPA: TolC family protein [Longimicrobiales bacterium]|nr:TolC family protein [Longimicrobiales bacterium]